MLWPPLLPGVLLARARLAAHPHPQRLSAELLPSQPPAGLAAGAPPAWVQGFAFVPAEMRNFPVSPLLQPL